MVLQVGDDNVCVRGAVRALTPEEVPCAVYGYEAAVRELVRTGVVDSRRIGIIGFSRTCIYTMAALTSGKLRFSAATINDGFNLGYFQYLTTADLESNFAARWMTQMIGAPPFSAGLQKWFAKSPGFNMSRVSTPLRIEAVGLPDVLFMWEPYAALRYLDRPVDLIVIQDGTHPLSNPAQRIASQGGNVDWFRFWLQGYEDPDSEKSEQYQRWEKLCDMQVEQNPDRPAFCVGTKH